MATGADIAATLTLQPATLAGFDSTPLVSFQPPVATPQRPALANYELWNPARTSRIAFVSPYDVLAGQVRFASEAAGPDTLSLETLRDAAYIMDGARRRELGGLGRALSLYDNPILVRRSADTHDAAFRLATAEDVPYGDGDILQRTAWKSLLYETQEEEVGEDLNFVNVLPHVVLAAIAARSGIVAAGDVDPALDSTLARFAALTEDTVWDALWKLADTLGCLQQVRLQTSDNTWTGRLRISLVQRPSTTTHILAPAFNLTPGATRQLATTTAFSRVRPYLADGGDISRARFMVREVVGSEIRTMSGDVLGPADDTWAGKTLAVFNGPGPLAAKLWSATVSSDRPEGDRHIIVLATPPSGVVTVGTYFGFFEDTAATEPVLYVRHKPLEDAIGVRQRVERMSIANELVENANPFLSEGYVGGLPAGGYIAEGTPTLSRNTLHEKDLDADGNNESLILLGTASWKAATSTQNHGQRLNHTLPQTLNLVRKPVFVRCLLALEQGQIKIQVVDQGGLAPGRTFTASAFPQLFGSLGHDRGVFVNIGNTNFAWKWADARVRVQTIDIDSFTWLTTNIEFWPADEAGTPLVEPFLTRNISYRRDGGTYHSPVMDAFYEAHNQVAPGVNNIVAKIASGPSTANFVKVEIIEARFVSDTATREMVSAAGVFDNFDFRFGPLHPIGDTLHVKILNNVVGPSTWYTDLIQVKRAEGLTDERAPLFDSGASEAIRQAARLWAAEEGGGERYSFTLAALDRHYVEPEDVPTALQVDQLARIVIPELDVDAKFPIVELVIDDFSLGNVVVSVARIPARLSRIQAQQTSGLRTQLEVLGELYDRMEVRVATLQEK